jgi:hypothetical protein
MPRIVISYRRADAEAITGRIFDRLVARYGRDAVFRDVDNIPLGVDFRHFIDGMLRQSDIILVVIGPRWLGGRGEQSRLANPTDPVRIEVATALRKGAPVIPILVGRTEMPKVDRLPDDIRDLAYRNGLQIDAGRDFDVHVDRLIRELDRAIAMPPAVIALPIETALPLAAAASEEPPAIAQSEPAVAFAAIPEPAVLPAEVSADAPAPTAAAELAEAVQTPEPPAEAILPEPEKIPPEGEAEVPDASGAAPIVSSEGGAPVSSAAADGAAPAPAGAEPAARPPRAVSIIHRVRAGAIIGVVLGFLAQLVETPVINGLAGSPLMELEFSDLLLCLLLYGVFAVLYAAQRPGLESPARRHAATWIGLGVVACAVDAFSFNSFSDLAALLPDGRYTVPVIITNAIWASGVVLLYRRWLRQRLAALPGDGQLA